MDPQSKAFFDEFSSKILSEIAELRDWPKIQIEKLKRFQCSFKNTQSQVITSGFFYLEQPNKTKNQYYPIFGTTCHALDTFNQNFASENDMFDVTLNETAKNDIFLTLDPPLQADYFKINEYHISLPNNFDYIYFKFQAISTINLQQEKLWQNYVIDIKPKISLGEKVVAFGSENEDVKVSFGCYMGDKNHRKLIEMNILGGFTGALASNATNIIGIVTGEEIITKPYCETKILNNSNEIGEAFVNALIYEVQHTKTFACISMMSEWKDDICENNLKSLNFI